jgi:hypothetical protein
MDVYSMAWVSQSVFRPWNRFFSRGSGPIGCPILEIGDLRGLFVSPGFRTPLGVTIRFEPGRRIQVFPSDLFQALLSLRSIDIASSIGQFGARCFVDCGSLSVVTLKEAGAFRFLVHPRLGVDLSSSLGGTDWGRLFPPIP